MSMARRKNTETKVKPSGAMTDRKRVAVPDRLDLRDRVYMPPVGVVPDLGRDQRTNTPVLDQGHTNACTGGDWWLDAVRRPLGAYYRVDTRSITDMHVALNE